MKTINYQGQPIEVELVNQLSGVLTIASFPELYLNHDGDEEILRDRVGQYYLQRSLKWLDLDGDTQRQASGRTYVHRISLRAAILWAIMRANAESMSLRRDAWSALTARSRLADAPASAHDYAAELAGAINRFLRGQARHSESVAQMFKTILCTGLEAHQAALRPTPTGHALTLHFTANQWGMLGQAAKFDGMRREDWIMNQLQGDVVVVMTDCYGHDEDRANCGWCNDEANESADDQPAAPTGGFTLALDARAAALLDRYDEENRAEHAASGIEVDDIVNGVVVNWLEAMLEVYEGRTDGEAIEEARQRRECADGSRRDDDTPTFGAGRRHAGNPADVALLAAAEPEPFEDLPPDQREDNGDDEDGTTGEQQKGGK